jgi:hypothetical protein
MTMAQGILAKSWSILCVTLQKSVEMFRKFGLLNMLCQTNEINPIDYYKDFFVSWPTYDELVTQYHSMIINELPMMSELQKKNQRILKVLT